jgi:hypothetical protein
MALAVIRKPAGGAGVAPSDVWNVATRWGFSGAAGQAQGNYPGRHLVQGYVGSALGADGRAFINSLQPAYALGLPYYAATNSGFEPNDAEYIAAGTVIAADTWYYVYLAPWNSLAVMNAHLNISGVSSGILAVSSVAPSLQSSGVRLNSVSFSTSPTSRWSVFVPGSSAVCIGAIRRNAANNGWIRTIHMDHENILIGEPGMYTALGNLATDVGGSAFTNIALTTSAVFPTSARSAKLKVHIPQSSGAGTYGYVISIKDTGGGGSTYYSVAGAIPQGVIYQGDVYLDVPLSACGLSFAVQVLNIGNSNLPSTISLIGYSW